MARRPVIDKRANRLRKALRRTPNRYIDLVQYLLDHHRIGYKRPTKKQARQMLLDGKVMVGSHKVGRLEIDLFGEKTWVLDPYLPADQKREIVVLP